MLSPFVIPPSEFPTVRKKSSRARGHLVRAMVEPLESRVLLSITVNGTDTSAQTTGATSLTWSDTVAAGTDRAMFVELALDELGAPVSSVTYGGVALTLVGRENGNHSVEIWSLVNPTVGTANIVVTFGATTAAACGAVTFDGVNQSTPTGTFAGATGTSATMSIAASSAAGDTVIDVEHWTGSASGYAIGSGQTSQWKLTNATLLGASTTAAGAVSATMGSTVTSSAQWEIGAVSIEAAAVASQVVYHQQPSSVTAGVADSPSIVVDVEDQFGNIVTTDSSNVTLTLASGPGSLSGTVTVAAVNGVATFSNIILDTAGNYTLTASDGSLTSATSSSFTVSAAAASKLAYGVQPSNGTAGAAISPSIKVDVEDQFGNIVTANSSNVTLVVASGPGSLSGTVTVAASSGVATFSNIILDTAGNYTLTASDGSLTSATSNSFTVSAAAALKLIYGVQPSNVTAGVAVSPSIKVDVEDQFGNIVTANSSNVTLAVASGPGSLSGTVTVAASGGVATFNNVKLDTAGNYTLTASDGALTTATSSSFTVNPAAASKVVYGVQPSNVTAGVADSPSIVVDVEDQFGNIVTTNSSNVTLVVASGPGSLSGTVTVAASSGVATFSNVKLDTAGNYTLTASDGALTTATSSSFTVNPAAASKVVYGVQPSNVTAGVADSPSIVVDVEDQFGNIATTNSSNVTLAVASGPGSLSGTVTMAASSGVATFGSVKLDTAGNYTLTGSDGSLTSVTSSSFTVSAAAASKLAYSVQPSNVTAGVADSPSIVVDVEDQFGNIVTTNSSNVTLAVASGPGSLSGTVTVAASGGVATFGNIILDTAGNYTLTASDGSLTSATSSSFTVSAAAASKLAYSVQPSNVTAGVADSPSIVVDVEDQFGNIATTNSSNVTLAVASGPGSLSGTVTVAAIGGVATFSSIILDTAGNYTLTASDGALATATSSSFTVNPAAASKVVYGVQPSNVTAGVADSPPIVVDVEDQFGNIVTTNSSNVTLSVASGPGSLSGTVTVAASSGIATFNNVKLDTAGNYTLTASDGSLTTATSNSFTVNLTTASKVVYAVQPSNVTAGVADSPSIVVDVEDQFGNIVTTDNSNVTLSVASGPGALSGTVTVAAISGVATFSNIILDTAGNYTLTASDGVLTTATSGSFTVNPAAASKVVYAVQPSNATAGVAQSPSIVVDVEDQFGNIVTANSSNVTLSVASGPGSLSGTVTVAASGGVATFGNVKVDTAGNYTLTASDGSLTSATSSSFTVSAAAASKLAYSVQPSGVMAGVAESPSIVVDVEDQFGNIVTANGSNVSLAVASGPGSLSGTVTVAANNGIATFSNIILDTAGNYTLTASDGSLTSATSSSFTVSAAAASKLVYGVPPSNVTAGVADSPSIIVDVEDQFGNIVTTNGSNVTLSVASGPGSLSGTVTVAASSGVATFSNIILDTAGNYTLTASDGSLGSATSSSFTVGDAPPTVADSASAAPNPVSGTTTNLSVLGADVGGESILTYTWSATAQPAGSDPLLGVNGTNAAKNSTVTFNKAGSYTFTCTINDGQGGTVTSSVNVTVSQTLTTITVAPASTSLNQNGTESFTAAAFDQFGNSMATQPSFTWSNTGVGSIDSSGLYTAPTGSGSATIHAVSGSITGTATVTVTNAAPSVATPASATPNPVTGTTTDLSVLGADAGGESSLTYTWATVGAPPASVNFSINDTNAAKNTVATFSKAGTYTFQVTIINSSALSTTSSVVVTVDQTLTTITIAPASAALHENATQSFAAVAHDQFGVAMATQPTFSWTVSGVGSVNSSGLYTAPYGTGSATVHATSASISGSATVTVTNAAPTVATPASATPNPVTGTTTDLSVLGADDGGESNLTYTWSATTRPAGSNPLLGVNGTNAAKNSTVTFNKAGNYTFTCTINDGQGGTVTSSVNVTVDQTLTSITVTPASGSLNENGEQSFSAAGFDQFGVAMATQPSFAWTVTGVGAVNSSGLYTAPYGTGSATVHATSGSVSGSATVTVTNAAPTVATPASATPNPVTGTTTALGVLGADDGGESNLTYTWSATAQPAGSDPLFSINGTNAAKNSIVTFDKAGSYTFTCTINDGQGGIVTSSVNVTVDQTLTGFTIFASPDQSVSTVGTLFLGTVQFDQFGESMAQQRVVTWSMSSGSGTVLSDGTFIASDQSGTEVARAMVGQFSGTISLTVFGVNPPILVPPTNPEPTVTPAPPAAPESNGGDSTTPQNGGGSGGGTSTIVEPAIQYSPGNPTDTADWIPDGPGIVTPTTPTAPSDQTIADILDQFEMPDNGPDSGPDRLTPHGPAHAVASARPATQPSENRSVVNAAEQSGPIVITPINRREMLRELDAGQSAQWDQDIANEASLKLRVGLASAIGSSAASVYLLWLIRSGGVLASLLSSAPVWKLVDPLFVLPSRRLYRAFWNRARKAAHENPEDRFFRKGRSR
jgi:plastocyanin